jgi:tetratricopeptide (TPR) repeat protein
VVLTYAGRYPDALPLAERPIELDPQFPEGYHIAGFNLLCQYQYGPAKERLDRAVELSHRSSWPVAKCGCALAGLGRTAEARVMLAELEQRAERDPTICAPAVATLYLHLGDHDAFYRWMDRGLEARDPYALALKVEGLWERARGEPRFQAMLERVGLAPR